MIKAAFHPYWGANRAEDLLGYPHDWVGDRYAQPLRELKKAGLKRGIEMYGTGYGNYREADVFFFWERPRPGDEVLRFALHSGKPMYLLATEPVSTLPDNGDARNLLLFDKIFCWYGMEGPRYRLIRPIYFSFPPEEEQPAFAERKLCAMIASIYVREADPFELYSKRAAAVRWFEANHPDDLDFYGRQNRFTDTRFAIYRGPVDDKLSVLQRYRFQLCYENSSGMKGYISEKIFDAFFAGCVPVYWGAEDVKDFIPGDCFLDRRDFSSDEALYRRMTEMDEAEYQRYRGRARAFLETPFAHSYDQYALAKALLDECFAQ